MFIAFISSHILRLNSSHHILCTCSQLIQACSRPTVSGISPRLRTYMFLCVCAGQAHGFSPFFSSIASQPDGCCPLLLLPLLIQRGVFFSWTHTYVLYDGFILCSCRCQKMIFESALPMLTRAPVFERHREVWDKPWWCLHASMAPLRETAFCAEWMPTTWESVEHAPTKMKVTNKNSNTCRIFICAYSYSLSRNPINDHNCSSVDWIHRIPKHHRFSQLPHNL